MGPTFSVITIRPSGRNPSRHGRLKVATLVMTNGKLASGVWAPRLVWAEAPDAVKAANTAVFASFIFHLPRIFGRRGCEDFGRSTTRINETGLEVRRCLQPRSRFSPYQRFNAFDEVFMHPVDPHTH